MTDRRRLLVVVLLTPLLMLAAHTVMWFWAVGQLEQQAESAIAPARAAGWQVVGAPPVRGGWPLGASLTWRDLSVSGQTPTGLLSYGVEQVALVTSLAHPTRADLEFSGPQSLRLGEAAPIAIRADRMVGSASVSPGSGARTLALDAEGLHIGGERGSGIGHVTASVEMRADGRPFSVVARGLSLPDPAALGVNGWVLGGQVQSLALQGTLSGKVPGPPAPPFAAWLSAWRDGGGQLALDGLALRWGPLDLSATATLVADQTGQPSVAANLRVVGWSETADALAAAGLVSRDGVKLAKTLLSLTARIPSPGAPSEIDVPLSLRDGSLSVARIPLARLPPLR